MSCNPNLDNYSGYISSPSGLKFYPYAEVRTVGLVLQNGTILHGDNSEALVPGPIVPPVVNIPSTRCNNN